jgi:hypothetical protein
LLSSYPKNRAFLTLQLISSAFLRIDFVQHTRLQAAVLPRNTATNFADTSYNTKEFQVHDHHHIQCTGCFTVHQANDLIRGCSAGFKLAC